ncbi:MAG: hypothetical protein ABSE87_13200 [Terracidiphilus sp.]|jgi:hypothetical protein
MPLESSTSVTIKPAPEQTSGWLKVGVVAAASVLVGGLAAAWWYRKTLTKLNQAETNGTLPECGTSGYDPGDEV